MGKKEAEVSGIDRNSDRIAVSRRGGGSQVRLRANRMCEAKAFERHKPRSCKVEMEGVGAM